MVPSLTIILHTYVIPTSREEPVSMLDNGLNDANNLQGQGGHHLRHVSGTKRNNRVATV